MHTSSLILASPLDRTPEEFTNYVKRLEELAWRLVGDCEEYQALMEDESMAHRTYVEALGLLILMKSGGRLSEVRPVANRAQACDPMLNQVRTRVWQIIASAGYRPEPMRLNCDGHYLGEACAIFFAVRTLLSPN